MRRQDSSWKLECSYPADLPGLKLLHLKDANHRYPPHIHEEFCIAIILRGSESHICRGETFVARAGDLLCVNAEEAHASSSAKAEYKTIQFDPQIIAPLLYGNGQRLRFPNPVVTDPKLFRVFVDLYSRLAGRTGSRFEKESALVSTIEMLVKRSSSVRDSKSQHPVVETIRSYLRSHFSESISLSGLAEIADRSPFHLVRVFRNHVGVPPHEFQIQVRVANAQRMLLAGRSITDAAIETGFFDQSHFSRNFKRITGFTPGNYLAHSKIVQYN